MLDGIKIINLLLVLIFFNYVYQLEKNNCVCSIDWKRDFIKYYTGSIILRIILYNILTNFKVPIIGLVFDIITFLLNIFGLVYIWCLYAYSKQIKDRKCRCASTQSVKIMSNYSLFILGIYLILLVIYFFSLIRICL